ncbi:MAG: sigma-70 family RNA polymerase sigma factor [Verrucomicrobia bacterium]|nr:sigma-70 family RNA polymerase sigma factor [Verrucomicrobiota bacterium]
MSESIANRWIDRQRPFWRTESSNELAPPPPGTSLTGPAAIISFGPPSPRLTGCLLLPPIYRGTPEKELALRGQRCLHLMSKAPHFEKIFLPHLDAAYNLAHWILGDEREAEDVVQEAYARAWEDFPLYRGENPRVWLLTMVRAIASSLPGKHVSKDGVLLTDEQKDSTEKRTAIPQLEDCKQRFWQALNSLTSDLREVLVLSHLEGWSYQAIATALGVSLETVMSRLSLARYLLINKLMPGTDRDIEDEL